MAPDLIQRRINALPLARQLQGADRRSLTDDFIAGLLTTALLIPQGIAYALVAGLPAEYGLYAAMLPMALYALLGSSRYLSVGPVAVAALMVDQALTGFAGDDMPGRVLGAALLSAMTGGLLLILSVMRGGSMVRFISHPVLSGFVSGAALLIIASQIPTLLGFAANQHSPAQDAASWMAAVDPFTVGFSSAAIALLLLGRSPLKNALIGLGVARHAAELCSRCWPVLLVFLGTLLVSVAGEPFATLKQVGTIPSGMPALSFPVAAPGDWRALALPALLIASVAYVESVSVAKALGYRRREAICPDREMRALGVANLGASLVATMPVAGGFSRSVVNFDAGARSQLSGLIAAVLVTLSALFAMDAFARMPLVILSALICVAVWQLVEWREFLHLLKVNRADAACFALTLLGVMTVGVELGLIIGVAASMAHYVWRSSDPHIAVVGRVPGTEHYRNVLRHKVATDPRVLLVRVDENMVFTNADAIESFVLDRCLGNPALEHLVLVMNAVSYIDATGLDMLGRVQHALDEAGITLSLAELKGPVADAIDSSQFVQALEGRIFLSTDLAARSLNETMFWDSRV